MDKKFLNLSIKLYLLRVEEQKLSNRYLYKLKKKTETTIKNSGPQTYIRILLKNWLYLRGQIEINIIYGSYIKVQCYSNIKYIRVATFGTKKN